MMNTKLTIEKEVIEIAKKYAKEKGHSLSELVENYFKYLIKDEMKVDPKKISPKTQKLRGILKVEKDFDYKKILREELAKKYNA